MDERFDRIDQTLDRVLTLLMDHGRQLDQLQADMRELRTGVQELATDMREHLLWHLRQS